MKKQVQSPGVRKWFGDDFLNINQTAFDLIEKALCGEMGNIVISGVERSGASAPYDWSPGYVIIDGTLCTFEGYSGSSTSIYLTKDDTDVTSRNYINGLSLPVTVNYKAAVQTSAPAESHIHVTTTTTDRLFLPYRVAGVLKNVPKSDLIDSSSTNLLATAKAVNDARNDVKSFVNQNYGKYLNRGRYDVFIATIYDLFFDLHLTVTFNPDGYIKLVSDGTTAYTWFVEVFKAGNHDFGFGSAPASAATYHLTPSGSADTDYTLPNDSFMRFRIETTSTTCVIGEVHRRNNILSVSIQQG